MKREDGQRPRNFRERRKHSAQMVARGWKLTRNVEKKFRKTD
jgi:hypothetical protein